MRNLLVAAAAVSLAAFAAPAFAQTVDGSIGYSSISGDDVTLGAIHGRLSLTGTVFGVEGEGSLGIKDDTAVHSGPPSVSVDVKLKSQFGVFGTAGLPVGENGRFFARAGYATTKFEAKAGSITDSESEDGLAYGVGAQFLIDDANGVRFDYTKYDFGSGNGDADAWSLSYVRRFK